MTIARKHPPEPRTSERSDTEDQPTSPLATDALVGEFAAAEADAYAAVAASIRGRRSTVAHLALSMADGSSPSPFGNMAHLRGRPGDGDLPDIADALHRFYGSAPGGPFLFFAPWSVGDLGSAGFAHAGRPPLMVRTTRGPRSTTAALRIREVRDRAGLEVFERTLIDSYPVPEVAGADRVGTLIGPAALRSRWRFFVGYDGDRAVGTSAAFVTGSLTIVEMVSTGAANRSRGFGAALTEVASRCGGAGPTALLASDLGRPVYERLGFITVAHEHLWIGHR